MILGYYAVFRRLSPFPSARASVISFSDRTLHFYPQLRAYYFGISYVASSSDDGRRGEFPKHRIITILIRPMARKCLFRNKDEVAGGRKTA
jgi:hypothetical protein